MRFGVTSSSGLSKSLGLGEAPKTAAKKPKSFRLRFLLFLFLLEMVKWGPSSISLLILVFIYFVFVTDLQSLLSSD